MKLKQFTAEKVHGYLNFKVVFNRDLTFLVGGNGSGKTTALKLIHALLTPNFRELLLTPFGKISLDLEFKDTSYTIWAAKFDSTLCLSISDATKTLDIKCLSKDEAEYYGYNKLKFDEYVDSLTKDIKEHPVIVGISRLPSPVFLGLERRSSFSETDKSDYIYEKEHMMRYPSQRVQSTRRLIKGSLAVSLMETEVLVQTAYKRLRYLEERYSNKMRDSILLSAFQYTEFNSEEYHLDRTNIEEKSNLLKRRAEINNALSKIGISDTRLSIQVDTFFDRLTSLFESLDKIEKGALSIEWLTNKTQIDRISSVVEIIDEHKSKVDSLFKPISTFIDTINSYYSESRKSVEIDTVGHLTVTMPNGDKCNIDSLSSGERQLLIIFAHVLFNRYSDRSNMFIIDEPELSLHLRWQENFVDTIKQVGSATQFIMATHSPDIIGGYKNKSKRLTHDQVVS